MRTKIITSIAVALIAFVGYTTFHTQTTPIGSQELALNTPNINDLTTHWIKYTSKKGNFEVMFPNGAQYLEDFVVDTETKTENHYQMFVSEENDGTVFMISLATYPKNDKKETPQATLDKAIKTMFTKRAHSEIVSSEDTTFDELPAKNIQFKQQEYTILAKAFLSGENVYVLSYIAKTPDINRDKFNYFLSTFSFLPNT